MNKYCKSLLLAVLILLLNIVTARDFGKRKYYHFKKGNVRPTFKTHSIKKRMPIVAIKKDSTCSIIIPEEIKSNSLSREINKALPVSMKKPKPYQQKFHQQKTKKIIATNKALTTKTEIKIDQQEKVSAKSIVYYILSAILSICLLAGLVIGIIWLANLSLLGLIAAILISVLIVFYFIIAIAFSKGIS